MRLIDKGVTLIITKEEKKAFETVHEILAGVCNKMRGCDNCPLASICGEAWEPQFDIDNILNLCEVEEE